MKIGVYLPLMEFGDEGQSSTRVMESVDAGRECGLDAISANDHLVFSTAWLDGLTALAAAIERSGQMTLGTTVALPAIRGPVALAKALAALDILSEGRLIAGVGAGSSSRDYDAVGLPFEERWARFDESVAIMRSLVQGERAPATRFYTLPHEVLAPLLRRDPDELSHRLCVGSAEHCAGVLSDYARAGCDWVQLWPLGQERRQIEMLAERVIPEIAS